jgi:hypothetical protein
MFESCYQIREGLVCQGILPALACIPVAKIVLLDY